MYLTKKRKKGVFIILILLSVFPHNVYAYIDPGNGSYILQVLLASLFGGLFALKLFWKKIKHFFAVHSTKRQQRDTNDE